MTRWRHTSWSSTMIVTERPDQADQMMQRADEATTRPRTQGWHVSDLVQCLRKSWYDRHPDTARPPSPADRAYFLLGKSQHALLQMASPDDVETPVRFLL